MCGEWCAILSITRAVREKTHTNKRKYLQAHLCRFFFRPSCLTVTRDRFRLEFHFIFFPSSSSSLSKTNQQKTSRTSQVSSWPSSLVSIRWRARIFQEPRRTHSTFKWRPQLDFILLSIKQTKYRRCNSIITSSSSSSNRTSTSSHNNNLSSFLLHLQCSSSLVGHQRYNRTLCSSSSSSSSYSWLSSNNWQFSANWHNNSSSNNSNSYNNKFSSSSSNSYALRTSSCMPLHRRRNNNNCSRHLEQQPELRCCLRTR